MGGASVTHQTPMDEQDKNTQKWANYNDLTATSLEIMASKGNHPKMALIKVSELL